MRVSNARSMLNVIHRPHLLLVCLTAAVLLAGGANVSTRLAAADAGRAVLPPTALETEDAGSESSAEVNDDDASARPSAAMSDTSKRASFLKTGETLTFRLSWGIFSNAGELRIETTEETSPEHGRRFRVRVHTKSKGLISAVFPVDSSADSWIDPVTGRPLLVERSGREGDREAHATTVYDYENLRVIHTDHNRPKRSGETDLPDDEPAYDTFVVMMLARSWNLKVGDKRTVLSSFEDDIYEIEATAIDEDRIKTPAGRFDVVEIELKQLGELKGFFKKGGAARFFLSKGEEPQIVRIELRAKAGTFVMQLVSAEETNDAATDQK